MKKILLLLLFVSILVLPTSAYTNVDVAKADQLIADGIILIDVRTQEEYDEGHINGSILIPYNELEDKQDLLPSNLTEPILVYCRSGRRSAIAADTLEALGYTNIYNMNEGYLGWVEQSSNTDNIISITEESPFYLSLFILLVIPIIKKKILSNKN